MEIGPFFMDYKIIVVVLKDSLILEVVKDKVKKRKILKEIHQEKGI